MWDRTSIAELEGDLPQAREPPVLGGIPAPHLHLSHHGSLSFARCIERWPLGRLDSESFYADFVTVFADQRTVLVGLLSLMCQLAGEVRQAVVQPNERPCDTANYLDGDPVRVGAGWWIFHDRHHVESCNALSDDARNSVHS